MSGSLPNPLAPSGKGGVTELVTAEQLESTLRSYKNETEWFEKIECFAAWYEPENYKESPDRIYNGSGQLIYRGVVMDYKTPIPSIRLKAQRRGLQDYEYFWLLAQKSDGKQAADALVNSIVYKRPFGKRAMLGTEIWRNNPEEWDKIRLRIGEQLAR
jgi:hypothetical protein